MIDRHQADPVVRGEQGLRFIDRQVFLRRSQDGDEMSMGDGRMNKQAGGIDMGHDHHQIDGLVIGCLVDLQRIHESAVIVAGIRNSPDDGDRDSLDAYTAIEAVDRANQARCVTRRQLQEILVNAFFVVGLAVKEDVCDLILLSALKDRFLAVFRIELFVLGAYAR